jgi:hypothetical protein
MGLRYLELFPVDGILHFEMDLVLEVLGQAQVLLVDDQGILVLAQNVYISFVEFFGYL